MKKVVLGIIHRENKGIKEYLLITAKKDFGKFTGLFYPCGGHVEDGETIKEALIREVKEELGIQIIPINQISQTGSDIADQVTYWWECQKIPSDTKLIIDSNEVASVGWFKKEEILNNKDIFWPTTYNFFFKYFK